MLADGTDCVEDCECPDEASVKPNTFCLDGCTVMSDKEVTKALKESEPLSTACLLHASGGWVTETAHNEKEPECHSCEVATVLLDYLTSTDEHTAGCEAEADVAVDGMDAHTLGTTE